MTTTAQHLATCATHWRDLHDALGTPNTATWPPSGLNNYLTALDQLDAEEARQARELEVPSGAPPLRIQILDTMRSVEAVLTELADQTASSVQRPVMGLLPDTYPAADRRRRAMLVVQDRADPRRWRWTGTRPGAPYAALWLLGRVQGAPGPFRRLTAVQLDHITSVAAEAAGRVEAALELTRKTAPVPWPCPHCRGELRVEGGDGTDPAVRCRACGWARTGHDTAAA
jgi:hypothetical protein